MKTKWNNYIDNTSIHASDLVDQLSSK